VIGARDAEARRVLTSIAAQRGSDFRLADRDFSFRSLAPAHQLDYLGTGLTLERVELGVAGPFQHENAAIVLAAVETLREQGWQLGEQAIRHGLKSLRWPGRFDVVSRKPLVILDCAHNELSIAALLETIAVELGPQVRPRLIFGCLEDKQWARMAAMLAPKVRDVTPTRVRPKRPLEPERLLPLFAAVPARVIRAPESAVGQVMAESAADEVIVVTGSVYLVGEIYPYFLKRQGRRGLFPEAVA
jgi:dihydrofolate synthase/folylpolyglutamate synthase